MSDKANCKNCIHFDEIKRRCCLNDDSLVQKECYFRRNNKKPIGNDIIFEKQGNIIKDLQQQLDQQKAMWNELKEWCEEKKIWNEKQMKELKINTDYYTRANMQYLIINRVIHKMQELEKENE